MPRSRALVSQTARQRRGDNDDTTVFHDRWWHPDDLLPHESYAFLLESNPDTDRDTSPLGPARILVDAYPGQPIDARSAG